MKEYVKLLEQLGFSVINDNTEYIDEIEIIDLKTNEKLQKKGYHIFVGNNNREIVVEHDCISINCGDGLIIKYERQFDKPKLYEMNIKSNDGEETNICFEYRRNSVNKRLIINFFHENNKENHFVENILKIEQRLLFTTMQKILINEKEKNEECNEIDIENCNTEIYINAVMDFINNIELTTNDLRFQKGLKIILPYIHEYIEFMINDRIERIESNYEYYIKEREESKVNRIQNFQQLITEETKKYETEIEKIDSEIERLRNLSQSKPKTK